MALNFLNNGYFAGSVGVGLNSVTSGAKFQVNGQARIGNGSGFTQANSNAALIAARGYTYGLYTPQMNGTLTVANTDTEGTAGFISLAAHYGNTNNTIYSAAGIGGGKETAVGDGGWGGYLSFYTTSDGTAGAASGAFEHMRVTADGNVGIGTISPTSKLSIRNNGAQLSLQRADALGTEWKFYSWTSGLNIFPTAASEIYIGRDGATTNLQLHNGILKVLGTGDSFFTGNVGIGTTGPGNKLTVATAQGTTFSDAFIGLKATSTIDTTGRTAISLATSTVNNFGVTLNGIRQGSTSGEPRFGIKMHNNSSGGLEAFSIRATGNVGIGTTSPSEKLDVAGNIKIQSALLSNQENTDVDTGTETVANVATATYTAAFFDFVIKKGTNVRSGTVYACHNGDTTPLVEFTETSTQDLGDTSDVTLSVDISGTNMRLLATTTSDDWSVKSLIRAI